MSTIILPNSIRKIESGAFSNFSSLVNIIIPNSVTNIGSNAFFNCPSLESVTISKNVKNIGDHAFSNCPSLDNIYYQGSIEQWKLLQEGWWWKAEIPRTIVDCNDGDWEI